MEFPLSKREIRILKEIETKFNANPNKLYIVNNSEEFAVHREIMELLEQTGFIKESSVPVRSENHVVRYKQSYKLLTDFSEVKDWIENRNKKAKRSSKQEWKIAIFCAISGLIAGVLSSDVVITVVKELFKK